MVVKARSHNAVQFELGSASHSLSDRYIVLNVKGGKYLVEFHVKTMAFQD